MLYIAIVDCEKNGKSYPALKFGGKVVTFDPVILTAVSGKSYNELKMLTEPLTLAIFTKGAC